MAIHGSFSTLSLPDLISLIYQQRKSGVLTLINAVDEREIVFCRGDVAYATTRDFDRRLGMFLGRVGAIEEHALAREIETLAPGEELFLGARLLAAGKIDSGQLKKAVGAQVLDIFKEVLDWESGVFLFDDTAAPPSFPEHGGLSSRQLLLEAARLRDEESFARTLAERAAAVEGSVRPPSPPVAPQQTPSSLPISPHVPGKLFYGLTEASAPRDAVGEVVREEPMLVAKLLKTLALSNREIRSARPSIPSLIDALGESQVRRLLLCEAVRGLNYPTHTSYWEELWTHSKVCARIAEFVAAQVEYPRPAEAYLAGLVHNLGAFLLLHRDPARYRAAVRESLESARDLETIEKEAFGVSHIELGGQCAEQWSFPRVLLKAVESHHRSEVDTDDPLLHILALARGLAHASGYRVGYQSTLGVQFEDALGRLQIDREKASELYDHVVETRSHARRQRRSGRAVAVAAASGPVGGAEAATAPKEATAASAAGGAREPAATKVSVATAKAAGSGAAQS
jgi:HD-like signal output (HDOD) protein